MKNETLTDRMLEYLYAARIKAAMSAMFDERGQVTASDLEQFETSTEMLKEVFASGDSIQSLRTYVLVKDEILEKLEAAEKHRREESEQLRKDSDFRSFVVCFMGGVVCLFMSALLASLQRQGLIRPEITRQVLRFIWGFGIGGALLLAIPILHHFRIKKHPPRTHWDDEVETLESDLALIRDKIGYFHNPLT